MHTITWRCQLYKLAGQLESVLLFKNLPSGGLHVLTRTSGHCTNTTHVHTHTHARTLSQTFVCFPLSLLLSLHFRDITNVKPFLIPFAFVSDFVLDDLLFGVIQRVDPVLLALDEKHGLVLVRIIHGV